MHEPSYRAIFTSRDDRHVQQHTHVLVALHGQSWTLNMDRNQLLQLPICGWDQPDCEAESRPEIRNVEKLRTPPLYSLIVLL
jgi:hypothetical protein